MIQEVEGIGSAAPSFGAVVWRDGTLNSKAKCLITSETELHRCTGVKYPRTSQKAMERVKIFSCTIAPETAGPFPA